MFKTMLHLHLGRIISKESLVIMAKMCCIQKITRTFISFFPKGVQCPRRWLMMSSLETVYPQPGWMSTYSRGDRGETQDTPREGPGPAFETGPESSVGAARKGFDPWSEFQGTKSEFFPKGPTRPARWTCPPPTRRGGPSARPPPPPWGQRLFPTRRWATFQNMVLRGELSYDRVSDRASIDRAVKTIEMKGYQRALEEFSTQVRKGLVSKDIATLGQQLLVNASQRGRREGHGGVAFPLRADGDHRRAGSTGGPPSCASWPPATSFTPPSAW